MATPTVSSSLPYKVIQSTSHDEAIIIGIPGAGETANSYCDIFSAGRYRRLAKQRGYTLVCLSGYGISMRSENYESRLIALRDELVRRHPKVKKVFLTGYSVGGRGALLVGLRHPSKFDGVGAIVPWMRLPGDRKTILPEIMERIKDYPHQVFIAWAVLDFFFPLRLKDQRRLTVEGEGIVRRHRYLSDHWFVVAASANDMFNFFDQQRDAKTKTMAVRR